ncbi:MAG: NAD(P)-dependent oxidoreductase [Hyphomicrobiales bacterium]|nr:NAD(P)-dependent oxidoreductase [Hyphomicrobiales bacterium]
MAGRKIERVGLIGLGKMGNPMARHMMAKGFPVVGFDVDAETMAAAVDIGVTSASTPAEVAASCDIVIVVVGFDAEVDHVIFADDGLLAGAKPGAVIAIASTVAPQFIKRLPARLAGKDVHMLDIPLTRGEDAAEKGRLLILGGGDEAVFDVCRPVFEAFSDAIFHLGPLGAGQIGKMVNNLILWACISANYEGFKLAETLGVSPERLREALAESSAQNWAMDTRADDRPVPWAEKDMTIVLKEADLARLSLPLCGVVKEVIKGFKIERGLPMPKMPE